ncbi:hypothetical protein DFS33DRAFT_1486511 [Desarmillaria ectypa]|nr:hypothetical protein DFS33DRAFT_1486511 [Desarmillaria ectypa]
MNDIKSRLAKRQIVTDEEEAWMDGAGNLVDKKVLLDCLRKECSISKGVRNLPDHLQLAFRHLKDEEKWREQWDECGANVSTAKRVRQTQHLEVTEMMELRVNKAMQQNVLLTGEVLRQKWTKFANFAGQRLGLKGIKCHGEVASANPEAVTAEHKRMQDIIKQYSDEDTFNMDETALFFVLPLDRGLSNKK